MQQKRFKKLTLHPIRQWWQQNQWLVIGIAWVVALVLGYIGFARNAASNGTSLTPWDLIYLTIQLIPMNSGAVQGPVSWELNAARLLIPLLTAITAVRALAALFQQQADLVRLQFIHDHIVICGLSQKGLRLTDGFRDQGDQVLVESRIGRIFRMRDMHPHAIGTPVTSDPASRPRMKSLPRAK